MRINEYLKAESRGREEIARARLGLEQSEFFKYLGDPIRLRCLLLLRSADEICVCDLVEALGESQPKVSRHLAALRAGGLVQTERRGQWIHYRLHDRMPDWQRRVIEAVAWDPSLAQFESDPPGKCS